MPAPRTPYEAVLHAARDVIKLDSAFDAELLGSTLLGSVYAVAEDDRAAGVRHFVGDFLVATAEDRTPAAATIRAVFAALVPDAAGAGEVPAPGPAWAAELGQVRLTGTHSYGDVYGDQTSYVATFAYDDERSGGPEHAVVALIDRNIGIVKDVFVGPAEGVLSQIRQMSADDDMIWFRDTAPEQLRADVDRYMEITDSLESLPEGDSLATDRALVGARIALLPASAAVNGRRNGAAPGGPVAQPEPLDEAGRAALLADFRGSPEAAEDGLDKLDGADKQSLDFAVRLVLDHAETFPDADPLRWSPVMAQLFLLDWVHRRAVLDEADARMLPRALRAWVAFAAGRHSVPSAAAGLTVDEVDKLTPEFHRLYASGERRSPATKAMAQLIADGVDPADQEAVTAWLRTDNDRPA